MAFPRARGSEIRAWWAARAAITDAIATTPAGIACQVRFAFDAFGKPPKEEAAWAGCAGSMEKA